MKPQSMNQRWLKFVSELAMLAVAIVFIVPVWMVFVNSIKTTAEANQFGIWLPSTYQLNNYVTIFRESNAFQAFLNGIYIAGIVGVMAVFVSSMASFFIARSNARLSRFSYIYFISGLIIPVAIIPTYFALITMHLNNTYIGLILVFVTYTTPLSIFLYTGFMKTIPKELDEAAIVDGCNGFAMFFKVIFPLLGPVTMTVVVFNFVGVWNDVMTFLYFANGDKWTLPMTVYSFFGKYSQNWNLVFADIMFTIIPCLLLFAIGQKYIVSGMTAGAVKG